MSLEFNKDLLMDASMCLKKFQMYFRNNFSLPVNYC